MEHFEELRNRPSPISQPEIDLANEDMPLDCNIPTKQEILMGIRQLKNGKTAGPKTYQQREAVKADIETTVDM